MEILFSNWEPYHLRLKDHFPNADSMQASSTANKNLQKKFIPCYCPNQIANSTHLRRPTILLE